MSWVRAPRCAEPKISNRLSIFLLRRKRRLNREFVELLLRDFRWRTRHQVARLRRLRERDAVADIVNARKEHDDAIQTERESPVRRSAELQRVDEETELLARLFARHSEQAENFVLNLGVVNTDRAAARFKAVKHEVVRLRANRADRFVVAVEFRKIFDEGSREGMVLRNPTILFFVPCR